MRIIITITILLITSVLTLAQQSIKPVQVDISDTHWVFLNFHSEIKYGDFGHLHERQMLPDFYD